MENDLYTRLWELIREGKKEMAEYIERTDVKKAIIKGRVYVNDINYGIAREIDGYVQDVSQDVEQFLLDASVAAYCNRDAR